ncbi:methyl-accepting chemotaxis protein [Selenomonas sputigena]|uniref:Methyl-accepting chemotaxis sensory transducer with Cache sensor n=2 Tax=Selenomonas sputigena (strain ATCC 35185 / DSM 20758 / CCUG 44933 / VPI D19B-28) TaxID=546271 RepID=F4EZ23_SELS3|nr:methyl-accepting chemotaxis protein [Selenomonas sputigena]AEB99580.1 methyl-accepting chemotaxis sensory transducer with Cache sensor [Selenomonas sputigena ATCC 35185]
MFHFASSSLRMKFIILMVGTSLVTVICITALWLQTLRMEAQTQLENYRTQLLQDVDTSLKNETQIVVSLLEKIYQQQQAGLLSEPEAKKIAADLVRDLRYDDGKGYFWIDTADGVNVVLLGRDVEGKSRIDLVDPNGVHFIQEMLKNGRQPGGGYTDLSFAKPGETTPLPKRNYTTTFAPYQWVLGTGVWIDQIDALIAAQKEVIDADFYSSLRMTVLVSVLIEALCIALAIFFSNKLATPIAHVTNRLATLAQGDFRHNAALETKISSTDEIGRMSQALDTLQHNVRQMMKQAIDAAEKITTAVAQLNESADQSATVSSQVAFSMSKVADSCNEQFAEMDRTKAQIGTLEQHMSAFAGNLSQTVDAVDGTNRAAAQGATRVNEAVLQMQRIAESVSRSAEVITVLGEESDKIGTIVDAIAAIADQTNLLALNAAIEAARAGENGRGFAVVAEEVRKLAEQSSTSADEITALITSIQEKAQNAVEVMQEGASQAQGGTEAVDAAGRTFKEIASMVEHVASESSAMGSRVHELEQSTHSIRDSAESMNKMSRSVAAESQTVSAATQEQTAAVQQIAAASHSLNEMSQAMHAAISKFKV